MFAILVLQQCVANVSRTTTGKSGQTVLEHVRADAQSIKITIFAGRPAIYEHTRERTYVSCRDPNEDFSRRYVRWLVLRRKGISNEHDPLDGSTSVIDLRTPPSFFGVTLLGLNHAGLRARPRTVAKALGVSHQQVLATRFSEPVLL